MRRTAKIIPLKKPIFNCLLGAMCIFLDWYSGQYEYLLASCWYFKFDVNAEQTSWKTKSFDEGEVRTLLNFGVGIDYIWHDKQDLQTAIEVIKEELAGNMPVGFVFDAYYCPWSTVYNQEHVHHFFLITQITNGGCIQCVDNISNIITEISLREFKCGYEKFITFHDKKQLTMPGVYEVLKFIKENSFYSHREKMFEDLRTLANFLENLDIYDELLSYSVLEGAPILRMFRFLEGGKLHFGEFLTWIYRSTGWHWCSELANSMAELAQEWNIAKGLLIKAAYLKNTNNQLHRLSQKVLEITMSEEKNFRLFRLKLDASLSL